MQNKKNTTISRKRGNNVTVTADPRVVESVVKNFLSSIGHNAFSHYLFDECRGPRSKYYFLSGRTSSSRRFLLPLSPKKVAKKLQDLCNYARYPLYHKESTVKGWKIKIVRKHGRLGLLVTPTWCQEE